MKKNPLPRILIAWIGAGIVRVLIGSSTSPVAYFFFGVFWLVSFALLAAAIRSLVVAERTEQRVEAMAICVGLASLFVQGLLGNGHTIAIAALLFIASAITLIFIYARKLRRGSLVHS